jgi:hypothetical protein
VINHGNNKPNKDSDDGSVAGSELNYTDEKLDKRWQENLKKETSQVFDKEVIRCWEGCYEIVDH